MKTSYKQCKNALRSNQRNTEEVMWELNFAFLWLSNATAFVSNGFELHRLWMA